MIQKAGGVIRRQNADGAFEVYIIHRPRYDDWTIPKGHIDLEEDPQDAAVREVQEETGLLCVIRKPLPPYSYVLPSGQQAMIHLYDMEMIEDLGQQVKDDESDCGKWVPLTDMHQYLTHQSMVEYLMQVFG